MYRIGHILFATEGLEILNAFSGLFAPIDSNWYNQARLVMKTYFAFNEKSSLNLPFLYPLK